MLELGLFAPRLWRYCLGQAALDWLACTRPLSRSLKALLEWASTAAVFGRLRRRRAATIESASQEQRPCYGARQSFSEYWELPRSWFSQSKSRSLHLAPLSAGVQSA